MADLVNDSLSEILHQPLIMNLSQLSEEMVTSLMTNNQHNPYFD